MPKSQTCWEYVLLSPDVAQGGASQIEITRWLEFADIALQRDREHNEAA